MLQDRGKEQRFVFAIAEALREDFCRRVRAMRIGADLESEIAYFVLHKADGCADKAAGIAAGSFLPDGYLLLQGRRQRITIVVESMKAPADHVLPAGVFRDIDRGGVFEPGWRIGRGVVIGPERRVVPGIDERVVFVLLTGLGGVVGREDM